MLCLSRSACFQPVTDEIPTCILPSKHFWSIPGCGAKPRSRLSGQRHVAGSSFAAGGERRRRGAAGMEGTWPESSALLLLVLARGVLCWCGVLPPAAWPRRQLMEPLPALGHDLRAGEFPGEEVRADGGAPQHQRERAGEGGLHPGGVWPVSPGCGGQTNPGGGRGRESTPLLVGSHPASCWGVPPVRGWPCHPRPPGPAGGWASSGKPSPGSSLCWRRGTTHAGTPGPTATTVTASCPSAPSRS